MSVTLIELMKDKLANFKVRFADYIADDELAQSLTATELMGHLISVKPYWTTIESHDEQFIEDVLTLAKLPRYVALLQSLSNEERVLLWRYVDFFLACVKQ